MKIIDLLNRFHAFEDKLEFKIESIGIKNAAGRFHPFFGNNLLRIIEFALIIIFTLSVLYIFAWRAPRPFPDHILITIDDGEPLSQITRNFDNQHVIRSSFWLKILITSIGGEKRVIAGDYYLPEAVNVFEVSRIITAGKFGLSPIRVVIPEGLNSMEIADILANSLPRFDRENFIDKSRINEGYLFPDTYFLLPNIKLDKIIALMRENFIRKVNTLKEDIEKFGKPLEDVIIMASIVEDEARTLDTRRIISGILWKRLRLKMPLQADATFKYYNGKGSFDLSKEDLEEDNPYNTYKNKGLPPGAISNPGLDAIRATIAPTNTEYLFFLSDKNGVMHYAVNFEEHKKNRELYLR